MKEEKKTLKKLRSLLTWRWHDNNKQIEISFEICFENGDADDLVAARKKANI